MFSSFFMFSFSSFFMFSFLYIVHFCRIIAAALISELISHPFPSQKGVIRGLLRGDYGVIRGIFSVRCYEENIPLGVNLLSADSPPF